MKIIDLTHTIEEGMFTVPVHWHPKTEISILGNYHEEARASRKITLGSHTGTHIDAPSHFIKDGQTIDQTDLNTLIGDGIVLNLSHKKSGEEITDRDLEIAAKGIELKPRILIYTGWGDIAWNTPHYSSGRPYLSTEAAKWLVDKAAILVGVDFSDPENPKEFKYGHISPMHTYFFEHQVIIIENLCNLGKIVNQNINLIALPLLIKDSDGSPARVVAIIK